MIDVALPCLNEAKALPWVLTSIPSGFRPIVVTVHDLGPMRAGRREQLIALDLRDRQFGYPLEMVLRAARTGQLSNMDR